MKRDKLKTQFREVLWRMALDKMSNLEKVAFLRRTAELSREDFMSVVLAMLPRELRLAAVSIYDQMDGH